ncbi:hypothetical protein AC625_24390 [Peribacillus loiseleuriae]|uniref:Uncharacterized protein n=1 Tax=Peribacillus loiseleuriae TaxID=1679170 RepID=A0A0K9G975_9BACI|nr:hypothetical protein AC625_24390 [Peribacillus loiseleuriae]
MENAVRKSILTAFFYVNRRNTSKKEHLPISRCLFNNLKVPYTNIIENKETSTWFRGKQYE